MIFKQVLMFILFAFFAMGLFDRAIGNRFGIGKEFSKAMDLLGLMTLSIVGMICLTPALAKVLIPVVTPLYTAIGADPAMFAPNFISVDSGGYSLATQMAEDPLVGRWAGVCIGALLGATLSFNVPVLFGMVGKENYRTFSIGALSALIASPFGCLAGGFACGLPLLLMLKNLVPVIFVSFCVALGLILIPNVAIKLFVLFSRFLTLLIAFGLALAVLQRLTGVTLLEDMLPVGDGLLISGTIAFTCAGAICMVYVILHFAEKPLRRIGKKLGLNEVALLNILICFSTIAPGGAVYNQMNPRGKVVFSTLACTAANILGAHMGFVASQDPEMLPALFAAKLTSGILAVPLAIAFARKLLPPVADVTVVEACGAEQ